MASTTSYWLVFLGGGLGSIVRFGLSQTLRAYQVTAYPLATLIANITACFLIGIVLAKQGSWSDNVRILLAAGFCGGFSTFSTFSIETLTLLQSGAWWKGIFNIMLSVVGCLLATYAGLQVGK